MVETLIFKLKFNEDDQGRFSRFLRRDEDTGCLIFTGCCHNKSGYGRFRIDGKIVEAHKVAWIFAGREITPEKPCILHNCPHGDDRLCCEISHLWAGSIADNAMDLAFKDRGTRSYSGLPYGVSRKRLRFTSRARINSKLEVFGYYDTWAEASAIALYYRNLAVYDWLQRRSRQC